MPTYEYVCEHCGHEFEQFQAITARPLRKCPHCGRRSLQRLIGCGGGVIFKGSGFYQTDYRSEAYKKAAEAEKKGASSGSEGSAKTKEGSQKSPAEAKGARSKKSTTAA